MLNEEVLTATEVASILHIGRNAVYDLAKSGELSSYRMGRKLLFTLKDVESYLSRLRTSDNEGDNGIERPEQHLHSEAAFLASQPDENRFRIGGIGLPAGVLVDRLNALGTNTIHAHLTSYAALLGIYEKKCDAAVIHLFDQKTNSYNIPYVQRLAPGVPVVVFRLVKRWQSLLVAKGNPKRLTTWGGLLKQDIRLANNVRGCGSRILLDEKLLSMEVNPETLLGYDKEYPTGLMAARAVADRLADVAVASEQVAAQLRELDFIPLQQEWIDLVVAKGSQRKKLVRDTRSILSDDTFKSEYSRIVHGYTKNLGAIVYEC